jgi:hypothetical protein
MWALGFDVDIDPVPSIREISEACDRYQGCVHATWSHRLKCKQNPKATARYRLILITSRAMTRDEQPRVWEAVHRRLPFKVGSAARDAARLWFVPSLAEDGTYEAREFGGEPIDVDAMLREIPAEPESGPRIAEVTKAITTDENHKLLAAQILAAHWPPIGTRHHARLALAGALMREGWTEDRTTSFVLAVCQSPDDERTKHTKDVQDTFRRGSSDSKVTGWQRLEEYVTPSVVGAARDLLKPYEAPWNLFGSKPSNDGLEDAPRWISARTDHAIVDRSLHNRRSHAWRFAAWQGRDHGRCPWRRKDSNVNSTGRTLAISGNPRCGACRR